jgi:uncharacterized protein YjbI with pentapeptide repeats
VPPAGPAGPGAGTPPASPQPVRSRLWFLPVAAILLTAAASQWGGALATLRGAVFAVFCAATALALSGLGPASRLSRGLMLIGVVVLSGALLVALAIPRVRQAIQPESAGARQNQGEPLGRGRLQQSDVNEQRLRAAGLQGAVLDGLALRSLALQGLKAEGASFKGADLRSADLRAADLRGARMQGADLRGAELRGACLAGAQLDQAQLAGADFSGADVSGASFPADAPAVTIGWASAGKASGACL